jgi:hypothetical protein
MIGERKCPKFMQGLYPHAMPLPPVLQKKQTVINHFDSGNFQQLLGAFSVNHRK